MVDNDKKTTLLIHFRVQGLARFLSHAETLRLFGRAAVRAGLDLAYSSGFNPRPKVSLPLPRSVGTEALDETAILSLSSEPDIETVKTNLSAQLPEGIELLIAEIATGRAAFNRCTVTYELACQSDCLDSTMQQRINNLLGKTSVVLTRKPQGKHKIRKIDVRNYLESIEIIDDNIRLTVGFGPEGSIRLDEIMTLLKLDLTRLTAPIRRTKVQWLAN